MHTNTISARVLSICDEAEDIRTFILAAADDSPLPTYTPGAHLDVYLPGGLTRQYSLCGRDRHDGRYRIAVQHEAASRGGSRWLHEHLHKGDVLTIGRPRNAFALAPSAGRHLLLAGGIGITPLLAMAYELAARGEDFRLAYFARNPAVVAFATELQAPLLASRCEVLCSLSTSESAAAIASLLQGAQGDVHCYTCGPAPFMDAVRERALAALPPEQFHQESFGPVKATGECFTLRLQRSGRDVAVGETQSVVEAMRAAGVDIETSCEVGVCGTCVTRVIDGCPDHRDSYLTAAEQGANTCFTPCVSRSRSALLVVDA